jgi:hypothetical protein
MYICALVGRNKNNTVVGVEGFFKKNMGHRIILHTHLAVNFDLVILLSVFSPWSSLTGTRAQSGDRYGSGTLHSEQVLRGSLPLLSPVDLVMQRKFFYQYGDF